MQESSETVDKDVCEFDDVLALNRFIWLKTREPNYINVKKEKVERCVKNVSNMAIEKHLENLNTLGPVNLILKAIQSNSLPSNDESLMVIAYFLCKSQNEDLKKELRSNFLKLIPTAEDLLYFMNYFHAFSGKAKLSLARGMRTCLEQWYLAKSATELLEIIFATEKVKLFSHGYIVRKLHLHSDDADKNEVAQAAFMSNDQIKAGAVNSTTLKKILKYKDLKRCTEVHQVVSVLKRKDFNYKLQHIPTNAVKSAEVMELILPNMTLSKILDSLEMFCNRNFLNVQDSVSKKICNALQVTNKVVKEAKLNPFHVFGIMRILERQMTMLECSELKNENTGKSVDEKNKEKAVVKKFTNPLVIKKLQNIFYQTLSEQTKTGCRYYVTLCFRKFSRNQSKVCGMENILCSEVQTILALSLLKNEKNVTVMTFTDDTNKLKPVQWTKETTYDKAMESFATETKEKSLIKENIILPLKKAAEEKKKVDVFITVVSSVGRTMGGKAKPPVEALETYRNAMGLNMTKMVVINLARKQPDFKFEGKDLNATGILEIVGFSADSLNIIEAYAKNCFV